MRTKPIAKRWAVIAAGVLLSFSAPAGFELQPDALIAEDALPAPALGDFSEIKDDFRGVAGRQRGYSEVQVWSCLSGQGCGLQSALGGLDSLIGLPPCCAAVRERASRAVRSGNVVADGPKVRTIPRSQLFRRRRSDRLTCRTPEGNGNLGLQPRRNRIGLFRHCPRMFGDRFSCHRGRNRSCGSPLSSGSRPVGEKHLSSRARRGAPPFRQIGSARNRGFRGTGISVGLAG